VDLLAAEGLHVEQWANAGLSATTVATSSNPALSTFTGNQMDGRLPPSFQVLPGLVEIVLMNWGVNDFGENPDETTWIAQYSSMVEYVHGRFPNAKIYITYPWCVNCDAPAAQMHGWIDQIITAHAAYTYPGVDEAIVIKADDNGFLETDKSEGGSGVHYTALGAHLYAEAMAEAVAAHF